MCHKGYLSLFPFVLELLPPTSPHLGHILDLVHDPEHLWSSYGIRSLSASHPEFGKGENYWKGPIWMHINYLALRALHNVCWLLWCFKQPFILFLLQTYAAQEGPYQAKAQTIYKELRRNVVDNVFKVGCPLFMKTSFFPFSCSSNQEFERTGYTWEQYDAITGEGRRRYVMFFMPLCEHFFTPFSLLL